MKLADICVGQRVFLHGRPAEVLEIKPGFRPGKHGQVRVRMSLADSPKPVFWTMPRLLKAQP